MCVCLWTYTLYINMSAFGGLSIYNERKRERVSTHFVSSFSFSDLISFHNSNYKNMLHWTFEDYFHVLLNITFLL